MRLGWLRAVQGRSIDPWVVDAALVACSAGLTVLAVKTPWSPLPLPVIALAGVAGSLAVWWQRRRPGAVAGIGAVTHVLSGNPGPLVVGLYQGAAIGRRRWLPLLTGVGTVGVAALGWVERGAVGVDGVGS